jgi:hypothetical protein
MLECDERHFPRLEQRYGSLPVACVKAFITRENIAELFAQNAVPTEFGMLSIDVDGNDYWLWEALAAYRPYLVVIEYNGTLGPEVRRVQVYDPLHQWNPRMRSYGASLGALAALGRRLGYALVGTDCRGINAFFVRKDVLGQAGFPELDVSTAFHPHRSYQCFLPYGTNPMLDI